VNDRLVVGVQGFVQSVQIPQRIAQVLPSWGMIRFERDGFAQGRNGLFKISTLAQNGSQIAEGVGIQQHPALVLQVRGDVEHALVLEPGVVGVDVELPRLLGAPYFS